MRRGGWLVGCVVLVVMACSQVKAAEVSELIPEDVLVAVVAKDMRLLHTKIGDLVDRVAEGVPVPDLWDELLEAIEIQAQVVRTKPDGAQALEKIPTTVDRTKAFVMLVPNPGEVREKEAMLALMVPVSDYEKFLKEVAEVKGEGEKPAPVVKSADGLDVVGDEKAAHKFYFTKRGDYAVMAASAEALKGLAKSNRSVHEALSGQSRKTFEESDISVYANCDQAVRTFRPDLEKLVKKMQDDLEKVKKEAEAGGGQAPPMQNLDLMGKVVKAEVELAIELGEQMDNTVMGINITKDDVMTTCLVTPLPNTMIAQVLGAQKEGPLKLMTTLSNNAWLAGCFYYPAGSGKPLQDRLVKFMTESGMLMMFKDLNMAEYTANMNELWNLFGGDICFAWYPPLAPENGILNVIEVVECKDPDKVRAIMHKQMAGMVGGFTMMPGMEVKTTQTTDVEPGIDRTVMEFKAPADPAANPEAAQAAMMLQVIYGGKIVIHQTTVGKKYVVVTLGDPSTKTIKEAVERLNTGQAGTLTTSPGFQKAVAGLPASRNALCYFSLPRMISAVGPTVATMFGAGPQIKFNLPAANDEAGVAMTSSVSGTTLRMDFKVPIQEIINVRKMIEDVIAQMQGQQ